MRDGISIGMSGEPLGVRNLHAAENQFSAFGEWMRVVADADAHEESIITLKPDPPLRACGYGVNTLNGVIKPPRPVVNMR